MAAIGEAGADLASRGFSVTAVDYTSEMVEEGRRRFENVEFVVADIRCLQLPKVYDFAFIGSNDLHHFQKREDRVQALTAINNHVRSGGGLGLELWHPRKDSWQSPKRTFHQLQQQHAGRRVWKEAQTSYDSETMLISIDQKVFVETAKGVDSFDHCLQLQLFDRQDLIEDLEAAGFQLRAEYGNYSLEPWSNQSPHWLVEAVKV